MLRAVLSGEWILHKMTIDQELRLSTVITVNDTSDIRLGR